MTYSTCILEFVQTIIHLTQISRQTIRLLVCCPTVYLRERWLDNPRILGAKSGTLYLSETSGNESGSIGVQYPQTSQWRLTKYKTHTLHSSFDHAYLMKLKLVRMTLCIVITKPCCDKIRVYVCLIIETDLNTDSSGVKPCSRSRSNLTGLSNTSTMNLHKSFSVTLTLYRTSTSILATPLPRETTPNLPLTGTY